MKRFVISLLLSLLGMQLFGASPNPTGTIRFIDYNILNGMWWDQYNNYDRFVDWMNSQEPDIFAICELATHWDKDKKEMAESEPRYLPEHLDELAARWGHPYVAIGPHQDNYPVAITSRYPIEVVQRIGEGLSHGALHVKIRGVNYIVIHTWPQKYSKGDKTRKDGGGDRFRYNELKTVLDLTINNPKFRKEKYWVMTGDMNSKSELDDAFYQSVNRHFNYDAMNLLLDTFGRDVVWHFNDGAYSPTFPRSKNRLDYIYTRRNLYRRVFRAETLVDEFTKVASDHYPILMEFKDVERN